MRSWLEKTCARRGSYLTRVLAGSGLVVLLFTTACGSNGELSPSTTDAGDLAAVTRAAPATRTAQPTVEPTASDRSDGTSEIEAPPPGGLGDLSQVNVEPQATLPAVDVDVPVELAQGLSADVALQSATVEAGRPGEIGGDAVEVTLTITNEGHAGRDISTVFVNVEDASGVPLPPLYGEPYDPLRGDLAPETSGKGRYVFTLNESARQPLSVLVSAAAEHPIAVFVGELE